MNKTKKIQLDKPLTLKALMNYNSKIFLPELEETFVKKDEFNNKIGKLEDKIFNRFDKLLKNTEDLKEEKEIRRFQRNKDKRLYLIIINALKQHEILGTKELKEISELGIF